MTQKTRETPIFKDADNWSCSPRLLKNGHYAISNHADVTKALNDPRFASSLIFSPYDVQYRARCPWLRIKQLFNKAESSTNQRPPGQVRDLIKNSFVYCSGEKYERLQSPIKKIFLSRLHAVQYSLASTAQGHLDRMTGKTCPWTNDVIRPYISGAIETLFDFPEIPDPGLYEWIGPKTVGTLFSDQPHPSLECYESFLKALDFIEACMSSPRLGETKGLIAEITKLSEHPAAFTKEEISGNLLIFLIAATFSAPRVLAGSLQILLKRTDLLKQLQENPGLISSATQEFLRAYAPVKTTYRQINENLSIQGTELRAGDWVDLDLEKANLDPRVFEKPEEILLTRNPNPHLAFGAGLHFCLGAPMARVLIETFLQTFIKASTTTSFLPASPDRHIQFSPDDLWISAAVQQ